MPIFVTYTCLSLDLLFRLTYNFVNALFMCISLTRSYTVVFILMYLFTYTPNIFKTSLYAVFAQFRNIYMFISRNTFSFDLKLCQCIVYMYIIDSFIYSCFYFDVFVKLYSRATFSKIPHT